MIQTGKLSLLFLVFLVLISIPGCAGSFQGSPPMINGQRTHEIPREINSDKDNSEWDSMSEDGQKLGLNINAITYQVIEHLNFYKSRCNQNNGNISNPTVYLALADITGDGLPEIFIGQGMFATGIKYSAYAQDFEPLPIGDKSEDTPSHYVFGSNYQSRSPDLEVGKFLFGKKYYSQQHDIHYYIARDWNMRTGAPSETFVFLCFWLENNEWHNQKYIWSWDELEKQGNKNFIIDGFGDPASEITVSEQIIITGGEDTIVPSDISERVEKCIRLYEEDKHTLNMRGE